VKVIFASFGDNIASSRLRALIPQQQLAALGMAKGRDVLVYGKHLITEDQARLFRKRVYDVCDNHFSDQFADYYLEHATKADLVTCNSETMKEVIRQHTGRMATVIPDPYESDEKPAGYGNGILWFGHESNLIDLHPYLDLKPEILTGSEWSRDKQLKALERCAVVMIPTGKSMAKSANRLIESVRNGRFVVAGELPAHDEFREFMWVGDIREGLEWFKAYPHKALKQVEACQQYIRDKYSPEAIGRLWFDALRTL
jgi:hypothetical protein